MEKMLHVVDELKGWLRKPAAVFTHALLQEIKAGPVCEIGVFRGKYLSVLRSAVGGDRVIVGYDLYPRNQQKVIQSDFLEHFDTIDRIKLIQADSTKLTKSDVVRDCEGAPVFMSIDGSHLVDPVVSDLKLTGEAVDDAAIVAMDDFLNPTAIGVNEAFYRYVFHSRSKDKLVPFAFITNKLFLAKPDFVDQYFQLGLKIIESDENRKYFPKYFNRIKQGKDSVRQLIGHDIIVYMG